MKVVLAVASAIVALVAVGVVVAMVTGDGTEGGGGAGGPSATPEVPSSAVDLATESDGPDDGSARLRGTIRWLRTGVAVLEATLDDVCPRDERRASVYVNGQNDNGIITSTEAVDGPRCTGRPVRVEFRPRGVDVVSVRVCEVAPDGTEDPCVTRGYRPE